MSIGAENSVIPGIPVIPGLTRAPRHPGPPPVIPGLTRDPQNFANIKGIADRSPQ